MTKTTSLVQAALGDRICTSPVSSTAKPTFLRFYVSSILPEGELNGREDDTTHYSFGHTDGINSFAHSIFSTVTSPLRVGSRMSREYCLTHYAIDPATNLSKRVISAKLKSFSPGKFTLTFDRADPNYLITVEVE